MSPEPTGHAKYPVRSYEGSWAPDQTDGRDRVPTSLDGGFLLSELGERFLENPYVFLSAEANEGVGHRKRSNPICSTNQFLTIGHSHRFQ